MKAAAIILAMLCLLWACSHQAKSDSLRRPVVYTDWNSCQYLSTDHDGALTPRMGADGKQICNAKEK